MAPRSARATTEMAPGRPEAVRLVPSIGSTATSTSGSRPLPICSPKNSIGASSFSPSPITTVPFMSTEESDSLIAWTARRSAASLFPRPCSGAATAGFAGSGLGVGSSSRRTSTFGAGFCWAFWTGFDAAARARGAWPRARDSFFAGLLEELTPEFSDPSHRVGGRSQSYDGRLGRDMRHPLLRRVGDAFRVNPDHTVVHASLLDDQRPHRGVALEAPRARDLQPVAGDHVPADQAGHGDPVTLDVRFDLCLGPDQQVTVALDLPAEVAEHLARPLEDKLARKAVLPGDHGRPAVQPKWVRVPVRAGHRRSLHRTLRHRQTSPGARHFPMRRLPPIAA